MDISWDDARLFLAVAETGSLSAAARRLSVAQPTVSRRLAELESMLGETLFSRSVEGARLTAFGETLLEPAKRMADWAAELTRAAERRDTRLEGIVRISAPPGIAFEFLAPFAGWLATELPGVRLEVVSSVRYVDLTRREADLALRMQRPDQKDLLVLASLELQAVPFVACAVAEKLGPSPRPADVDWIAWAPPLEDTLPNPVLARMIPGFRPAFASDDFLVQLRAAEAGVGAIFLGRLRLRFARETPLVEIRVQGIPEVASSLHLVGAKSALAIPRVRAVADLLAGELHRAETRPATAR